jgi:hypothetical protein
MKYAVLALAFVVSACSSYDADLQAHLKAEQDFHDHQAYMEYLYSNYDPEYVDDCFFYEDLHCEFE